MKVAVLLREREQNWAELDRLCTEIRAIGGVKDPSKVNRFSALYRAACADLALADAYQLPPQKIEFLQSLVARAHNRLYRSKKFAWRTWLEVILFRTPKLIFSDKCVHLAFFIWLSLSVVASYLAYDDTIWPGFAEQIMGLGQIQQMEASFGSYDTRSWGENVFMAGYYIRNNAGIGLQCFASGVLVLPGLFILAQNAIQIGAAFGLMFRPDMAHAGANFKDFVTAHGPFEITAIMLSAGAGLRLGVSWLTTQKWGRLSALLIAGRRAFPIIMCAVVLFCIAALIEGFISPIPRTTIPWWIKGMVGVFSCGIMLFYFVVLGYPGIDEEEFDQTKFEDGEDALEQVVDF